MGRKKSVKPNTQLVLATKTTSDRFKQIMNSKAKPKKQLVQMAKAVQVVQQAQKPKKSKAYVAQSKSQSSTVSTYIPRQAHLGCRGTEYLGTVLMGASNTSGTALLNLDIAPLYFEGTRIQKYAQMYEKYRFRKLRFRFVTSLSSNQPGSLGLAYDHDVMDPTPQTGDSGLRVFRSMQECKFDKSWVDTSIDITCKNDGPPYFTNESVSGDPRLVYQGQLYFFIVVPLTSVTQGSAIGTIEVDYDCEFYIPNVESPTTGYVMSTTTSGAGAVNVVNNAGNALQGGTTVGNFLAVQLEASPSTINGSGVPLSTIPSVLYNNTNSPIPYLREGYYLLENSCRVASSPVGTATFSTPVLTPKPGATLVPNNNTPSAGTVTTLSSGVGVPATPNLNLASLYALAVGAGGAFLDNIYLKSTSSSDTSLNVSAAVFNILPLAYSAYQAYVKTAAVTTVNPGPLTPGDTSSLTAMSYVRQQMPKTFVLDIETKAVPKVDLCHEFEKDDDLELDDMIAEFKNLRTRLRSHLLQHHDEVKRKLDEG